MKNLVHTVLGPISPTELGVTLIHESLLSVVPGAQFAYDIKFDRAEIFESIAEKLLAFKAAGGNTLVDSSGMFHGRDLPLYESLSKSTGVTIVASTGLGPEDNLGGYFLTPQTNPPTPWPAEKFEDLFGKEITEGMVHPRLERRAAAGLVVAKADHRGISATEVSLLKGAARAAKSHNMSLSFTFGGDPIAEVEHALAEGLAANQLIVSGVDRSSISSETALRLANKGVFIGIDNVGNNSSEFLTDSQRIELVLELINAGFADRIVISSNSAAVAKGHADSPVDYAYVLTKFVPALRAKGVTDAQIEQLLVVTPQALLTAGVF